MLQYSRKLSKNILEETVLPFKDRIKKLRKEKQKLLNSSLSCTQKEIQVKLLDRLIFNLWNQQNRYGN